jgi:hypothetical protein
MVSPIGAVLRWICAIIWALDNSFEAWSYDGKYFASYAQRISSRNALYQQLICWRELEGTGCDIIARVSTPGCPQLLSLSLSLNLIQKPTVRVWLTQSPNLRQGPWEVILLPQGNKAEKRAGRRNQDLARFGTRALHYVNSYYNI